MKKFLKEIKETGQRTKHTEGGAASKAGSKRVKNVSAGHASLVSGKNKAYMQMSSELRNDSRKVS